MTSADRHHLDTLNMLAGTPKYLDGNDVPFPKDTPFAVHVAQTRRVAVACVSWQGVVFAKGVAKRHPKDRYDPELGQAIALSRAFAAASKTYLTKVEAWTRPVVPAPDEVLARELRKANRTEARERKNERRRGARERFERETSGRQQRVFDGREGS